MTGVRSRPDVVRIGFTLSLTLSWWAALWAFQAEPSRSPAKGFYLEVPYVHQVHNYCGPAVLAMVFRYWERPIDQYQLAEEWSPFPKQGLSGAQMKESAEKHGFKAFSFSGDVERVSGYLQKGFPVIAAVDSSSITKSSNHFLVLVGWDPSRQEWIVHDPAAGAYSRRAARDFERRWESLEHWSLIIVPDGASPSVP